MRTFTVTDEHMKLLPHLSIYFNGANGWGSLAVDSKRPFGNGDMIKDMALILAVEPVATDDEEVHWPPGTTARMRLLYEELATVLSIQLRTEWGGAGRYVADDYSDDWRKA